MSEISSQVSTTPLIDEVANWIMESALGETEVEALVEGCFVRLHAAGIPLKRAHVGFRVLHPLYGSETVVWTPEGGAQVQRYPASIDDSDEWRRSPGYYLISTGTPFMRRRLTGPEAVLDFPVLADLAAAGGTDYLGYMVGFDAERRMGMVGSWMTDRETGFSDTDIRDLRRIQQRFAVALKLQIKDQIARNALTAYLGEEAGRQVLSGQIHLGEVQSIDAAIWYSDMRNSTGLADRMPAADFLDLLNRYFELSAGSVIRHGGQVLALIGDGVLAIFPIAPGRFGAGEASRAAIAAALAARAGLAERQASEPGAFAELGFGIGLHVGRLQFGNIGVPERLQFTVIGPAANEVARIEDLTKTVGSPIVASRALVDLAGADWRSHGLRQLAGTSAPVEVLSPAR
jgi:adenylate cyclase